MVRYASVTKHIFAALALNATGCAIRLDQRLGELLPALQPALADVTVGQALDMTGGLPDVRETLGLLGISLHAVSEAQPVMQFVEGLEKLNYEAGSEIAYSNTGYRLLEPRCAAKGMISTNWCNSTSPGRCRCRCKRRKAGSTWSRVGAGLLAGTAGLATRQRRPAPFRLR